MTPQHRNHIELASLAAIWGASFLFMRLGAAEFGAITLAFLRVAGASLLLVPLLVMRGEWPALKANAGRIALVGMTNSALPFICFAYAAQSLTAGLSAIFNATTPLWGALIAALWLDERLARSRVVGLAVGFFGVLWLAWDHAHLTSLLFGQGTANEPNRPGQLLPIAACLAAAVLYGFSANYTRRHLAGVPPMALASGSQLGSALALLLPACWYWPASHPGLVPWAAAVALALVCTAVAYILYFRLISRAGSTYAMSVTYLVPAFAVLWGWLMLGEALTPAMWTGCGVILLGTALSNGVLGASRRISKSGQPSTSGIPGRPPR
jgi:drug/metabolite transporter (DMT)-like permease